MKRKVYIETTIPSYYISRESHDIIIRAHQKITKNWWNNYKANYDLFISDAVSEEMSKGDIALAEKRVKLIEGITILHTSKDVERLAITYAKQFKFPKEKYFDCIHIAHTVIYQLDILLTWNCTHLANVETKIKLFNFNQKNHLKVPIICSPEELIGGEI
ncbi:MAG: type II toxin-antitoxin system VapC family toxin [Candidatus Hydrogenedentota bacterium]